MFSTISQSMAAFIVALVMIAFNPVGASGESARGPGGLGGAVGGAMNGVGGAVSGALGGGASDSPGGVGSNDGGNGNNVARGGNWAGAPGTRSDGNSEAIIIRRSVDREDCGNTLLDLLRGKTCADGEDLDQASYTASDEPPAAQPVTGAGAERLQQPMVKKATALKLTARLNVDEPVDATLAQPKKLEKVERKSPPVLSCEKAGTVVGEYGFSGINPSDCDGQVFAFDARRDGKSFKITLNAVSGELIQVSKAGSSGGKETKAADQER